MATIQDLHKELKDLENSGEGVGLDLRLDLADIITTALRTKRISQKSLAIAAGLHPPMVNRLVHGNANCEFSTAGNILFALGFRAKLVAFPLHEQAVGLDDAMTSGGITV